MLVIFCRAWLACYSTDAGFSKEAPSVAPYLKPHNCKVCVQPEETFYSPRVEAHHVKLRPHAKMPVIRFGGGQGQFLTFVWILIESAQTFSNSVGKSTRKSGFGTSLPEIFRRCRKIYRLDTPGRVNSHPLETPQGSLKGSLKNPWQGRR